jgi:hypothetical protein
VRHLSNSTFFQFSVDANPANPIFALAGIVYSTGYDSEFLVQIEYVGYIILFISSVYRVKVQV